MLRLKSPLLARISVIRARLFFVTAVVLLLLLWNTPYIFPLKLFTVIVHELTHALTAWATGGKLLSFSYDYQEGGAAITSGGNRFLILASGYLGSAFFGGLIITLATRTNIDRFLSFILGIGLAGLTFYYATAETKILFAYLFAAFYLLAAFQFSSMVCEALLILIGLANCCYAWIDIVQDVFLSTGSVSDATTLAQLTGFPSLFWGAFWLLLATSMTWFFAQIALNGRTSRDIVEEVLEEEGSSDE
ncbi:MAG: M50 family metallopeptidase [Deltaproteobacteria bacterium]|nr:M50 family metallopeptidase [Deltaproteobacteria bacterium]